MTKKLIFTKEELLMKYNHKIYKALTLEVPLLLVVFFFFFLIIELLQQTTNIINHIKDITENQVYIKRLNAFFKVKV